jgi:hypothetical protein
MSLWDRQKKWELKRDVIFEGIKRIAALDDALTNYRSFVETEKANRKPDEPRWEQGLGKKLAWSDAATKFDETRAFVGVICSKATREAFDALGLFASQIAAELVKDNPEFYHSSHAELFKKILIARLEAHNELGIEGPL